MVQHLCRKWLNCLALATLLLAVSAGMSKSQDNVVVLTKDMIENDVIQLGQLDGWRYLPGDAPNGAEPGLDLSEWQLLRPADLSEDYLNEDGAIVGWFRLTFRLDSTFVDTPLFWRIGTWGAIALYIDGELVEQYGSPSSNKSEFAGYNPFNKIANHAMLESGRDYELAFYVTDHLTSVVNKTTQSPMYGHVPLIRLTVESYNELIDFNVKILRFWDGAMIFALGMLSMIFWVLVFQNSKQEIVYQVALTTTFLTMAVVVGSDTFNHRLDLFYYDLSIFFWQSCIISYIGIIVYVLYKYVAEKTYIRFWQLFIVLVFISCLGWYMTSAILFFSYFAVCGLLLITLIVFFRSKIRGANAYLVGGAIVISLVASSFLAMTTFQINLGPHVQSFLLLVIYTTIPLSVLMYINRRYRDTLVDVKEHAQKVEQLSKEKQTLLINQNERLETQVAERTFELNRSLDELKKAQEQLIVSEKMASLGQLTAGIAHEIKNPLNFVTNFSDLTRELVMEAREEMAGLGLTPDQVDRFEPILGDIEMNVSKIHEHGKRADSIVKGMLQHSRGKAGERQEVELNELIGEYLNLAYHGLRAQDPSFNVTLVTDFDPSLGPVDIVPQDFSRAILNLVNNACFAADQKKRNGAEPGFKPTVTVTTIRHDDAVEIKIHDNGTGIPDHIKAKIFEPFFTTKPTGVGTGLGLSLTYEIIINQHGGSLEVNSEPGDYTEFRIIIPLTK